MTESTASVPTLEPVWLIEATYVGGAVDGERHTRPPTLAVLTSWKQRPSPALR